MEWKDCETRLGEHLRAVAGAIVADGRVDFDETTRLLEILKPLGEFDAKAVALRRAVEEVRADGVVTAEESEKLVALIKDFMRSRAYTGQKVWYNYHQRKEQQDEQRTEQAGEGE